MDDLFPLCPAFQACRGNKGVKAPGCYYFEALVFEEGPVNVGWATNEARLSPRLGGDDAALVFGGSDDPRAPAAVTFAGGRTPLSGAGPDELRVAEGDYLGCYLDLDRGQVSWSINGKECPQVVRLPEKIARESVCPGELDCSLITMVCESKPNMLSTPNVERAAFNCLRPSLVI